MSDVSIQETWSWVAPILLHVRQRHVGDGHVQRLHAGRQHDRVTKTRCVLYGLPAAPEAASSIPP